MSGAEAWERTQALLAVRDPTAGLVPGDASVARDRQRVSELFSTVCEVLRHFWAALMARDQVQCAGVRLLQAAKANSAGSY